ncbi:hypothetical protein ANCCEY_13409 [Ancylostoma ceylanicum]|uniref:Phlebovirus glycoprotein G2 fusion domain-containing protein n=2 Tax=Ancylostoma ceylanicum TaxID=53326 RepID=A0A0D6L8W0_9BILA|nr:hypothetical protein ANCCEY_13409 [Ancylostoma ceylanicum]EYC42696.1 hypothetical protein Y032_0521g2866 [Ancylostoma ceylanicum]
MSYSCFYCNETCLFYKYYAMPTSSKIYRIFTFPTWDIQFEGMIKVKIKESTKTHQFTLHPGSPFRFNNIKLALTSTISPNHPIPSSYFITDERIIARIEPAPQRHFPPNSPGLLQCKTKKDAASFNRMFSKRSCTCTKRVYYAACSCPNGTMSSFIRNPHNQLPILTKQAAILNKGFTLMMKSSIGSAPTVQISAKGLVMASKKNNNTCKVQMQTLSDCYQCIRGATTNASCVSSEGEETTQIECGNATNLMKCTPQGTSSQLRFHFTESRIDTNCTITCPSGNTVATLRGQLEFVNEGTYLTEIHSINANKPSNNGIHFKDVLNLFEKISKSFPIPFDFFSFKFYLALIC